MPDAPPFVFAAILSLLAVLGMTLLLSGSRRLPGAGRRLHAALCRAPGLDVVMAALTLAPPVVGGLAAGWPGLLGALLGQAAALPLWAFGHRRIHRRPGPRLEATQARMVGRVRNHAALWVSLLALPLFWGLRAGEVLLYPLIRRLMGFPPYRHGDWVSVSRHRHEGLVGHDLVWCLYCDWMTGVFSLAGEMLRNVESFWCPVQFLDAAKCEHCQVDFPDVKQWASPDGTLEPVVRLMQEQYGDGQRGWFGHPARLTIDGDPPEPPTTHEG